jgi:hypothetical protein
MVASVSVVSLAKAWPCNAARSACANSAAVAKRCSGRFAIALATTMSSDSGAVTESSDGRGGATLSTLCMIAVMLPSNGRSPVSI